MRTEGIYCCSVVATDFTSLIPFSSTERLTSMHGIDMVWICQICLLMCGRSNNGGVEFN